jgi:rSAM/selenodomain-associated transferase 1
MELAQLAVFVRPPTTGTVKTRLAAVLGEHGATALYRAFVEDTLRLCARVATAGRVDVTLWSAGDPDEAVQQWANRLGTDPRLQPPGDLGVKLEAAFEDGLRHYERVVIIGSDAPTLPIDLIGVAFAALGEAEMMLGPANDGGYYAIGATNRIRPGFGGVRWSTAHALEDTLIANAQRRVAIIPPWYDIDGPEDLSVLRAHLSVNSEAAPATSGCLAELSIFQR